MTADRPAGVRRVSSDAPWVPVVGYSRAVAAGDHVFVTGCTSIVDGAVVHVGEPYAQTVQAIRNIEAALAELGCTLADVVRTRMFVTDIERWEEYGRAHGELLGGALPATSMVEVMRLIDPRMLVEVEAVAYRPGVGDAVSERSAAPSGARDAPAQPLRGAGEDSVSGRAASEPEMP